jgi:hypothetical protein
MSLEFPFKYAYIKNLGKLFYPMVSVKLKTIEGFREFEFLVDTGADVTTVPLHLLPVLGIRASKLQKTKTFGVGGISIDAWDFKLHIKLGRTELSVRASAVDAKHDSMPLLLGRKDIFEKKFNLLLDSKQKLTIMSEN